MRNSKDLFKIYQTLYSKFGPQHWWPGESLFEIIVGAVLTQNTSWKNVEKALENLKKLGALSIDKLYRMPLKKLSRVIRPAGYFNVKAGRLKTMVSWLMKECHGYLHRLKKIKKDNLRARLLNVYGVGPETADSILLYGFDKKSFVVDAYTRRIFSRHGFISERGGYESIQTIFETSLPKSLKIYNEFHALIVKLGKDYCRKKPLCSICPLKKDLIQYFKKGNLSFLNEALRINTISTLTNEKLLYA